MLFAILLIMFAIGMLAQGASAIEVAAACGLILVFIWVNPRLDRWVELRTGRTSMTPSDRYQAVNFVVMMLIVLPPIYFLPGLPWLAFSFIFVIGMVVSDVVAHAYFGNRAT